MPDARSSSSKPRTIIHNSEEATSPFQKRTGTSRCDLASLASYQLGSSSLLPYPRLNLREHQARDPQWTPPQHYSHHPLRLLTRQAFPRLRDLYHRRHPARLALSSSQAALQRILSSTSSNTF